MIEGHGYGIFPYRSRGDDAVRLDTHARMRVPHQTTALGKRYWRIAHATK
nr:hypothetical protein [Halocatena marina]